MANYVALLRGIGPGNPNMRNERLRAVVEEAGFEDVQTVISSGNILFSSDRTDTGATEDELEAAWPIKLGFNSTTIVRSQSQLAGLVAADPYQGLEHGRENYLLVTFCKEPPELDWNPPYQPPGKPFRLEALVDGTIFSVADTTGGPTGDLMSWLEKRLGKGISSRTWKTVGRILSRMT